MAQLKIRCIHVLLLELWESTTRVLLAPPSHR
jgi:hypothetical protein